MLRARMASVEPNTKKTPHISNETRDRVQTLCLLALTMVAVGAALFWLRAVLIPFVLAIFLSIALGPLVEIQVNRLRIPRAIAVTIVMVLVVALLVGFGLLVSSSVGQLSGSMTVYEDTLRALPNRILGWLPAERFGFDAQGKLDEFLENALSSVTSVLGGALNGLLALLSQGFLVAVFVFFLLLGVGQSQTKDGVWDEIKKRIQAYVVAKLWISALLGIAVGGVLAGLHVPLALVFGVFTFILNFIPSIGAVVAVMLPLPLVLLNPEMSTTTAVLALAIPSALQLFVGNFVEVKVLGKSLDLHPVAILLSLIVWGTLWGVIGMLLAAPITAALKLALERIPYTAPFAALFASGEDKAR